MNRKHNIDMHFISKYKCLNNTAFSRYNVLLIKE